MTHVPSGYGVAFLDWLGCACAGAPRAGAAGACARWAMTLPARVAFAGAAGHVLDYDDTLPDGIAHVSAPCAPGGAGAGRRARPARWARCSTPSPRDGRRWRRSPRPATRRYMTGAGTRPRCAGPIGAAVVDSAAAGPAGAQQREHAVALAVLRAGGTRGAFGSDGKAIQVGLAAAAGVQAALMARAGAVVDARAIHGRAGLRGRPGRGRAARRRRLPGAGDGARAIDAQLDQAASQLPGHARARSTRPPRRARRATGLTARRSWSPCIRWHARPRTWMTSSDGLAAKFSIPYCVAARAGPRAAARRMTSPQLDAGRRGSAPARVSVVVDASLPEWGAVLSSERPRAGPHPLPAGHAGAAGVPGATWRRSWPTWPATASTACSTISRRPRLGRWMPPACGPPRSARAGADRRLQPRR